MCGRIAAYTEPQRLARLLNAQLDDTTEKDWAPHWNVGPTSMILGAYEVGVQQERARSPETMRILQEWGWGFVAHNDPKRRIFNARAESVATNGLFAPAFRTKRLLIPVDGFYEWAEGPRGKQPNYFTREDGAPAMLAGLQGWWHPDGTEDHRIQTATVITTAATKDMEGIHDRQPVVLEPDTWDRWLDPGLQSRDELEGFLHPGSGVLVHYPVDRRVGSVRNDDSRLVDALSGASPQDQPTSLF